MRPVSPSGEPIAMFVGAHAEYMFRFRLPVMRRLERRGYRIVVVATPLPGFALDAFDHEGITFIPWSLQPAGLNPLVDVVHIRALWKTIRQWQPDLLFVHTIKPVIYALPLAKWAGVRRRVCMIPGLGFAFIGGGGFRRKLVRLFARTSYRFALACADLVLLQNPDDRDTLYRERAIPQGTPTALVNGSGVDMARFPVTPVPDGSPVFLMVARLLRDKGVLEFVAAARMVKAAVPDARFVLVGGTDYNHASITKADVARWKDEDIVEVRGHIANPVAEFAACHVFVLPSYREGTPRTNLEAMAVGRAIVTTDTAGCRDTVTHGENGLLVPVGNADALAEAMLELARDPDRVRAMGAAGHARCIRLYELGVVTDATTSLILGDVNHTFDPLEAGRRLR